MHSSSRLFPVSLMRAEFAGHLNEDVYELNPRVSPDISVRVTVTRITDPAWAGERRPIILLHSEFHNRRQWLAPDGSGLAGRLAEQGFDVWLPEMRGHGLCPVNKRWSGNRLSDIAMEDWPALQRFVSEQAGQPPLWLGLGLGGLSLVYSLIHDPEIARASAGVAMVDCATPHWFRSLKQLSAPQRWRLSRRGYADGQVLGWGVEREPWSLFSELRKWRGLEKSGQHPVRDQLRQIKLPALVVALRDDEADARNFHGLLGGTHKELLVIHARAGSAELERPLGSADTEAAVVQWLASCPADTRSFHAAVKSGTDSAASL